MGLRAGSFRAPLSDTAIFDLHKAMFADLLEWAGLPRTEDVGPGGKVAIPFAQVREALRNFGDDFSAWFASAGTDPTLDQLASILADAHHRFQLIHPFIDTNGRTGRVLEKALTPVFTVHVWDGMKTTTCVAIHENPDSAAEDARRRSETDQGGFYRVLGAGGRVVVTAYRGRLVDEDGNPLHSEPAG